MFACEPLHLVGHLAVSALVIRSERREDDCHVGRIGCWSEHVGHGRKVVILQSEIPRFSIGPLATVRPVTEIDRPVLRVGPAANDAAFESGDWALFAAVSLTWGASFLFIDIGLDAFEPEVVTFLRVALGALALRLLPTPTASIDPADRGRVVVLSVLWVGIPFTLFPLAQQHINSAVTGLLNGATPIFVALVSTVWLKRAPRGLQLIGIIVGFGGVLLVSLPEFTSGSNEVAGVALALGATVCYGFAINLAVPLQQRYGSVALMARVLPLATVWVAPWGLWGFSESSFRWSSLAAVVVLGVVGTGFAFALMATLIGRVGSTRASFITYLIPVVALALGVGFRDDDVAPLALVGVVFVIGGALLASRPTSGGGKRSLTS